MPVKKLVSVTYCDRYETKKIEESIHKLLEPLGGIQNFISKGDKVLLKPNLLSAYPPKDAVTTHPTIVNAVAKEVIQTGGKPLVGDSPGHASLEKAASRSGIKQVCSKLDIPLIKFTKEVEVINENGVFKRFNLAKQIMEAEKIINLAKFKTHSQMLLTLAVKNCFGAVVGGEKKRWHLKAGSNRMHFAHMLVDICQLVKPNLNIVDAVLGMEGNGPANGKPRKLNFLIAGWDPFAVDAVGVKLIGINPMEHYVLKAAQLQGLFNPEEVEIRGEWKNLVVDDFKLPSSVNPLIPYVPNFLLGPARKLITSRPSINHEICEVCGVCLKNCPTGALTQENGRFAIDYGKCINCFCCQELCPAGAIQIKKSFLARFF